VNPIEMMCDSSLMAGNFSASVVEALITRLLLLPGDAVAKALGNLLPGEHEVNFNYQYADNYPFSAGLAPRDYSRVGFFSKYPLGVAAQPLAGGLATGVKYAVAAAVFLGEVALGVEAGLLCMKGLSMVLGLCFAAVALGALVWAVRSCLVGPEQATNEFTSLFQGPR